MVDQYTTAFSTQTDRPDRLGRTNRCGREGGTAARLGVRRLSSLRVDMDRWLAGTSVRRRNRACHCRRRNEPVLSRLAPFAAGRAAWMFWLCGLHDAHCDAGAVEKVTASAACCRSVQRACARMVAARSRTPVQHVAGHARAAIPGEARNIGQRSPDRHPHDPRRERTEEILAFDRRRGGGCRVSIRSGVPARLQEPHGRHSGAVAQDAGAVRQGRLRKACSTR